MQKFIVNLQKIITRQRVPASSIYFKSLHKEIRILLAYAIFYIIAAYLTAIAIREFPLPLLGSHYFIQDLWYSLVFKIILLLLVPGIVYFFIWKYRFKDLLLGLKPTAANILLTILFVLAGFFLNTGHIKSLSANIPLFTDAHLRIFMGVMMPLFIAAIPEELFFRGYLQTRLEKKWNRLSAIILTNILFAAWHLPSRYLLSEGVEGLSGDLSQVLLHTGLPVFIVGVIFSFHWSRARNIILLILTHWAIDILPSLSGYFNIR